MKCPGCKTDMVVSEKRTMKGIDGEIKYVVWRCPKCYRKVTSD